MEPSPLVTPRTPPLRATSEGPSPPPRNSMEDADSSVTRKRPRLDSGARACRSMSEGPSPAVATNSRHTEPGVSDSNRSNWQEQGSPTKQRPKITLARRHSVPPGEMTSQILDQKAGASPQKAEFDKMLEERGSKSAGIAAEQSGHDTQGTPTSSPSPVGSPEIEVAEPEDMTGHVGPTVWHKPGISVEKLEDQQSKLLMTFPLMRESQQSIGTSLRRLCDIFARGDLGEGEYLTQVAEWMDEWVQLADRNSSFVFEIYKPAEGFWTDVVELPFALLKRPLGPSQPDVICRGGDEYERDGPITQFFKSFATVFARFLRMDYQTLQETLKDADLDPDLGSVRLAKVFRMLTLEFPTHLPPNNLYKILQHCGRLPESIAAEIVYEFVSPHCNGMQLLFDCVKLLIDRTPFNWELLWEWLWCASNIAASIATEDKVGGLLKEQVVSQSMELFEVCDSKLKSMITKQAPFLTQEALKDTVGIIRGLLDNILRSNEVAIERMLPEDFETYPTNIEYSSCELGERIELCNLAWQLDLLFKCITKGRMENRTAGVDIMQSKLLEIFERLIRTVQNGSETVIPTYVANFLLEKKVVDYLVGVESHPRLVIASKNIVGFLLVTHKFGEREIDMIWDSMISNQDPRIVDAILNVVQDVMKLGSLPVHLRFVHKLMELPIQSIDQRMYMLWTAVLDARTADWIKGLVAEPQIVDLITRLLRQYPGVSSNSTKARADLFHLALDQVSQMMLWRHIGSDDRKRCLTDALHDLSKCSIASTGSIAMLNHLWHALPAVVEADIREASSFSEFVALVVKDLSCLRDTERLLAVDIEDFRALLTERLQLIKRVIVRCPDSFSPELMQVLWTNLVGQDALSDWAREEAWNHLTVAAQETHGKRNKFLDYCVTNLLPGLHTNFLTPLVLDFAGQLTNYEEHLSKLGVSLNEHDESLPGDIFWHIALEVPNHLTGNRAIGNFVSRNLPGSNLLQKFVLTQKHTRLVERCFQRLSQATTELKRLSSGSASSDEDSMVFIPSESDLYAAKLRCIRCLFILKQFMQRIRAMQPASPVSIADSIASQRSIAGDEFTIRYQPHVSGKASGTFALRIGDLAPLQMLIDRISKETGFPEFQLIAAGQRIDQAAHATEPLRDIKGLLTPGVILIQKIPGSKSNNGNGAIVLLSPLEQQVMDHFHDLYDLLCFDEDLGRETYNFLVTFPPHEDISIAALDDGRESRDIFPMDYPYKALYSVYSLQGTLTQKLQEGAPCDNFLQNGVQKIADALIKLDFPADGSFSSLHTKLIGSLVDCMLRFLKQPVPDSISDLYFKQPPVLSDRLRELIFAAQKGPPCSEKVHLIQVCFAAWIEACLHSPLLWEYFQQSPQSSLTLKNVWLQCDDAGVRMAATQVIKAICTALPEPRRIKVADLVSFFWNNIVGMLSETTEPSSHPEHFFPMAIELFRSTDNNTAQTLPLSNYLENWAACLLRYEHHEFVGRFPLDCVVEGFSLLLEWCVQLLKARKQPFEIPPTLMSELFSAHVFPPSSVRDECEREPQEVRVPVLHPRTREALYSLLLSLVTDSESYHGLLKRIRGLVPKAPERSSPAWSHGLAQISDDLPYELAWNFDRNKAIRSPTGYAGLRNLSNTCYLNSLLMQLFMNVSFREFVLNIKFTDPEGPQKLLLESQKLFAYLQETWSKAVDPENVVSCMTFEDDQPIDVSVQMDVDEFYNRLFDRWESQILSEGDKETFRKFYGGQLIQQIKSHDCSHISERTEPFSVIQCEILGRSTLVESLNAFVEGEILQGDNKYNCSSCNRLVNANKRACLKDVPDNLIFHLKRFDWDMATGTRMKVNERFEFPEEIDMAPYSIDYLKDKEEGLNPTTTPDKFVLVGILVHSGNAEAGHYYSYIRERPGFRKSWVEMNDTEVSPFDPASIGDRCFGGHVEQTYTCGRYTRSWNAYMLFYQRASSMEAEEHKFALSNYSDPVRARISLELAECLNFQNELWIRKYCLFGEDYISFIRKTIETFRKISNEQCSEEHKLEHDLIEMIIVQTERIFARGKDSQNEREMIIILLTKMIERCSSCCGTFLRIMAGRDGVMRALLFKCPDENFRKRVQNLLLNSLKHLKENDVQSYAPYLDPSDSVYLARLQGPPPEGLFSDIIRAYRGLVQEMHQLPRAWDEYYDLLMTLASMGGYEKAIIHDFGFLLCALQLLYGSSAPRALRDFPHVDGFVKSRSRRRISLRKLVESVVMLVKGPKLSADTDGIVPRRYDEYHLWNEELDLLASIHEDDAGRRIGVLQTVFTTDVDPEILKDIVRAIMQCPYLFRPDKLVHRTVLWALDMNGLLYASILAGSAFCSCAANWPLARDIISKFTDEAESVLNSCGSEFFDFFNEVARTNNPFLTGRFGPNFLRKEIISLIPRFAPPLLIYPDKDLRNETTTFLTEMIFQEETNDDEHLAELAHDTGIALLKKCLSLGMDMFRERRTFDADAVREYFQFCKLCFESFRVEETEGYEVMRHQYNKMVEAMSNLFISSPNEALSGEYDSDDVLTDASNVDNTF